MQLPTLRQTSFICFVACFGLLALALYVQVYQGVKPCPLCVVQRFIFFILAILFLIGALLRNVGPKIQRGFYFFVFLVALIGIGIAARHVWITHLPLDQVPPCGADLNYLIRVLPAMQVIKFVLQGTADCAKVTWQFLGLSISEWSLVWFLIFAVVSVWQSWRR